MESEAGLPPAKKRRFFAESSAGDVQLALAQDASSQGAADAHFPRAPIPESVLAERSRPRGASLGAVKVSNPSKSVFDRMTFEGIVGEAVPTQIILKLQEVAGYNLETAINMYFDSSWQTAIPSTPALVPLSSSSVAGSSDIDSTDVDTRSPGLVPPSKQATAEQVAERISGVLQNSPVKRYAGAFGVGAWATRSGTNLVRHGEVVRVERQKIRPPAPPTKRGTKPVASNAPFGRPTAMSRRTDIIVRFTNAKGEEVGRLPKETAAWVSTLIDQRICTFQGVCVYVPDRVRINDTIYLQLHCYMLRQAFEAGGFIKPQDNNRVTGIFEAKETEEEKDLRLRQIGLVKMFDEINLQPSRTSDTTEKHKKQGLLQAAEMAEQYRKEAGKPGDKPTAEGSPPPSEEAEDGKELEQDQLDSLYKKAQSFDFNTPTATPADTFAMDLRKYQKQALHWMMTKEKDEEKESQKMSMHPLWEEYSWPTKDVDDKELPVVEDQDHFYVNPYSGELSLEFPIQEQNCLGGILADEMGLGKTIEMLSLMHTHKSDLALQAAEGGPTSVNSLPRLPKSSSTVENAPCTTLVVAPMSLLAQWQSEAESASKPGTMKSIVYYGSEKTANLQTLCCEANAASAPDLIITSYGVILSEFNQVAANGGNRGSHGGLFSLNFFRVILDEAHYIKNRQSKTAKACYEISAEHRWVLTGTPIVNRLEDLFSLVRFLRVEPWSNFSFWKTFITVPFESKDFIRALDVVQTVLEPLVLRRTKDMKTPDGQQLVPLPSKTIEIEEIELSKPEREVYDHIFTRAKRTFAANIEAGTLLKSYTTIFAQILRLRQSCCHPVLTRSRTIVAEEEEAAAAADIANGLADDMDLAELIERFTTEEGEQDANAFGAHVLQQIRDEADDECPICSEEPMIEQAVTGCWHSACKKCLLDYIEHQKDRNELPRCFNCREPINQRDVFEVTKHKPDNAPSQLVNDLYTDPPTPPETVFTLRRINPSSTSAKISSLLSHLKTLRRQSPQMKSVVFSQFTSFLDLIEPALTRDKIPFLRFDGSMAQKARASVLTDFASPTAQQGVVLLLSLRAGGVGLNLTQAKRVFMMDPWWSFAVEAQAIDRVHRMGQQDNVIVYRFIVKDSVEQRMLKIQDRKKFIASSLGMMSDEEKKMQRIEDIKELLS